MPHPPPTITIFKINKLQIELRNCGKHRLHKCSAHPQQLGLTADEHLKCEANRPQNHLEILEFESQCELHFTWRSRSYRRDRRYCIHRVDDCPFNRQCILVAWKNRILPRF